MWYAFLTGILWIGGIAVFGGFALAFYDKWLDEHRGKVGKKELKKIQTDLSELRMDLVELKKSVAEIREFITDLYIQKYDE